MKVVQILPNLEAGGVERGTLEVAKALVEAGHESLVISAGGRMVEQLEAEGSVHQYWDLGRKSLLTFRHIWALRRWISAQAPDILHVPPACRPG
ncbi:MAG: glycosyltransferase [Amphritea sp.]